jgi:glucosamine-6-phosphate deaminase
MSIRQIMKSASIICTVSEKRKALAVKQTVEGMVTPEVPASVLTKQAKSWLFLDYEAASQLKRL